jgi:hypothetical protein
MSWRCLGSFLAQVEDNTPSVLAVVARKEIDETFDQSRKAKVVLERITMSYNFSATALCVKWAWCIVRKKRLFQRYDHHLFFINLPKIYYIILGDDIFV